MSSQQQRVLAGIVALRDATRALRGSGTTRRGTAEEGERGALIELASLLDRLSGFADDQREDDWADFWLTTLDVETLRRHTATLATTARGMSPLTVPALEALADTLASLAQPAQS